MNDQTHIFMLASFIKMISQPCTATMYLNLLFWTEGKHIQTTNQNSTTCVTPLSSRRFLFTMNEVLHIYYYHHARLAQHFTDQNMISLIVSHLYLTAHSEAEGQKIYFMFYKWRNKKNCLSLFCFFFFVFWIHPIKHILK